MNLGKAIFLLSILIMTSATAVSQSDTLKVAEAQMLIKSMSDKDQELRNILGATSRSDTAEFSKMQDMVGQMDQMHNIMLHKVIKEHGYLAASDYSMLCTHQFWILVMHQDQDLALQESVLEWMRSVWLNGEVIGRDVAYLSDRVAVNKGECQVYGTQFRYDAGQSKNVPFEICEVKKVKKLRKRMGLKPFEMQVRQENQG